MFNSRNCYSIAKFRIPGCAPIPVSRDASPSRLFRSPSPGFCGMRTNFRIPGCVKISYLLSKMLQVIFIGINETRQGAQNKKKWSSFSAIGTSISSVHVSWPANWNQHSRQWTSKVNLGLFNAKDYSNHADGFWWSDISKCQSFIVRQSNFLSQSVLQNAIKYLFTYKYSNN